MRSRQHRKDVIENNLRTTQLPLRLSLKKNENIPNSFVLGVMPQPLFCKAILFDDITRSHGLFIKRKVIHHHERLPHIA